MCRGLDKVSEVPTPKPRSLSYTFMEILHLHIPPTSCQRRSHTPLLPRGRNLLSGCHPGSSPVFEVYPIADCRFHWPEFPELLFGNLKAILQPHGAQDAVRSSLVDRLPLESSSWQGHQALVVGARRPAPPGGALLPNCLPSITHVARLLLRRQERQALQPNYPNRPFSLLLPRLSFPVCIFG